MIEFDYMILGVIFALISGYCRALFECIILFDSLFEKHGIVNGGLMQDLLEIRKDIGIIHSQMMVGIELR